MIVSIAPHSFLLFLREESYIFGIQGEIRTEKIHLKTSTAPELISSALHLVNVG